MSPNPNIKGKSFLWGFGMYLVLFFGSLWLPSTIPGLGVRVSLIMWVLAGFVPFLIQLFTGYALDGRWTARFSRTENPREYRLLLLLSGAFGASLAFFAVKIFWK